MKAPSGPKEAPSGPKEAPSDPREAPQAGPPTGMARYGGSHGTHVALTRLSQQRSIGTM